MVQTLQGQKYSWKLSDRPIGSGDAGEVYAVSCVDQPELEGVMKKPTRIATGGTIQRQAGQIAQECLALERLDGLPRGKAHPPRLLDQAHDFTQGTANYFFVSELAPGETMAALLQQSRQTGKPFPRRIIITVLDALFDLFSRAHKAGVLWNDVKLDHIYWHDATSQIAVIDWGNALFLEQRRTNGQRALPRWEDYRQMVEILGSFLKQTAPELYTDLGWDEFQHLELDATQVSVLARRIAYQQQVVALNVMEYQSLIRILISAEPTFVGFQEIEKLQQKLERIGAPWERDKVLEYAQRLVMQSLVQEDVQTTIRVTAIVWRLFETNLDLPWYLIREYLRDPDLINHPKLEPLVRYTFNAQWSDAIWTMMHIIKDVDIPPWWQHLMPVVRQQATGSLTPPPLQLCQTLLDWYTNQGATKKEEVKNLSNILKNWRTVGKHLQTSPYEYAILDSLRAEIEIPKKIHSDLKKSFSEGEQAIREVARAWDRPDWKALHAAFQQSAAWDPDRLGILHLAETAEAFQDWLHELHNGPSQPISIKVFLENLNEARPPLDRLLGRPNWLKVLLHTLDAISLGTSINALQSPVERWCPWLIAYRDIYDDVPTPLTHDQTTIDELLSHFSDCLRNGHDEGAALQAVKAEAAPYYPLCQQLAEGFSRFSSLSANLENYKNLQCDESPPALSESCHALQTLLIWREHLDNGSLDQALMAINAHPFEGWQILDHVHQQTRLWNEEIIPLLQSLLTQKPSVVKMQSDKDNYLLSEIYDHSVNLLLLWNQVYSNGLPNNILMQLVNHINELRDGFIAWRRSIKEREDSISQLFYINQRDLLHQISQRFYKLSEHIRLMTLGFSALQGNQEISPRMQLQTGENILEHLGAIEEILITAPEDRHFPEWYIAFRDIFTKNLHLTNQQMILSLPESHPLYAWLVQSTFG